MNTLAKNYLNSQLFSKEMPQEITLKYCTKHGNCKHDSSECHLLKKDQKVLEKILVDAYLF